MSQQWECLWRDELSHLGSTLWRENLIFESAGSSVLDLQVSEVTLREQLPSAHTHEQLGAGRRSVCPGDAAGIPCDAIQLWHCCQVR